MKNGKRYFIKIRQEKEYYTIKIAYWFDKRVTQYHTYEPGFYERASFYYPYKNVVGYIDANDISKFFSWKTWKIDPPIEGEKYLVYRIGNTYCTYPHYTIRKFHKGSFGSNDVKCWIKLSKMMKNWF